MLNPHLIVPKQVSGSKYSISKEKCFSSESEAFRAFDDASNLLLNINEWQTISEDASAKFSYYDTHGSKSNDIPEKYGFIRIKIPGPANPSGKGYDWVKISNVQKSSDPNNRYLVICVNPSQHPKSNENVIAHFYDSRATNVFIVQLINNCVKIGIYGRNEHSNINLVPWKDKIRNFTIAVGGMLGIGKIQWNNLASGIVNKLK